MPTDHPQSVLLRLAIPSSSPAPSRRGNLCEFHSYKLARLASYQTVNVREPGGVVTFSSKQSAGAVAVTKTTSKDMLRCRTCAATGLWSRRRNGPTCGRPGRDMRREGGWDEKVGEQWSKQVTGGDDVDEVVVGGEADPGAAAASPVLCTTSRSKDEFHANPSQRAYKSFAASPEWCRVRRTASATPHTGRHPVPTNANPVSLRSAAV
ncbi:hypothetical protein HMN09_00864800 [Mycena chlorophos]|uniref:Uncharacterized protein n=1 Tax=Mycena chlorophos TaxID=658473 RepID=A0A8H6SM55_MYCCL|nr:hypothetical protein HMN09_00864800 [Mycena chlorophos]